MRCGARNRQRFGPPRLSHPVTARTLTPRRRCRSTDPVQLRQAKQGAGRQAAACRQCAADLSELFRQIHRLNRSVESTAIGFTGCALARPAACRGTADKSADLSGSSRVRPVRLADLQVLRGSITATESGARRNAHQPLGRDRRYGVAIATGA